MSSENGGTQVINGQNNAHVNNGNDDDGLKALRDVVHQLPPHVVKDLLSIGVCVRCIFRLFGIRGHIYSCSLLSVVNLCLCLGEDLNEHIRVNKDSDDLNASEESEAVVCNICLGILQFTHHDVKEVLVKKDSAHDLAVSIAEVVKREDHHIDNFSFEVSIPQIILENEHAALLYMKRKYGSECWIKEKFLSERISAKEALKFSVVNPLEKLLDVQSCSSSFSIRLTYTHTRASQIFQKFVEKTHGFKRQRQVWQKLEEENHEFFKAYHVRLSVKEQIEVFNKLLDQQVKLMPKMLPAGVASMPVSNGSHMPQLQQSSACYVPEHTGPELKPDNMHQPIGSSLPNGFTNGGSALHTHMHTAVNMSAHRRRMDAPPNMLQSQSSDMRIIQGMNGGMIKSEPGYSGDIPYIYGNDGNALELRPAIGGASFNNVDPNSQALHEQQTLLDGDISPFGLLGTIPRNFSLSDLASDFSQSSDILESYSRSPFLPTDTDFLDSHERGENQGPYPPS